jgi:ABC-type Co2+ transport system permease subunit
MIQTILTAIIAIYYAFAFYDSVDQKRWLWALIGAGCFVVVSLTISSVGAFVVFSTIGMTSAALLMLYLVIGVSIALGCMITNLVKKQVREHV